MANSSLPSVLVNHIQAFQDYVFGRTLVWDYTTLEVEVLKYFDQWGHDAGKVDELFNRFASIWGILYQLHEFNKADFFWDIPLEYTTKWETSRGKRIHKGSPYYFRAMAAVSGGNTDRGFLFFHQALAEDERTFGSVLSTPAWSFVTLDYVNVYQAALQIVKRRADWLEQQLYEYQKGGRGKLSLVDLRNNVLNQANLKEATFSFVHSVFRSENILSLSAELRSSPFASQLELDTLFSLCRIAEVWLKDRQPPKNKYERQLGGQLLRLFTSQHWPITSSDLGAVGTADFEQSLAALLDGKKGPLPRIFKPVEGDLILIYILRNQAGHASVSSPIIWQRFPELLKRTLFGLFSIGERLF